MNVASHELLRNYLAINTTLSAATIGKIDQKFQFKHIKRGEVFIEEGKPVKWLCFLVSGIVYAGTPRNGSCFSVFYFPFECRFFSDIKGWYHRNNAHCSYIAATDCRLLCIGYEAFDQLLSQNPDMKLFVNGFGEKSMLEITNQHLLLRIKDKNERYNQFRTLFPELYQRVSCIYLAPFLQMSYSYLCHIRSRKGLF